MAAVARRRDWVKNSSRYFGSWADSDQARNRQPDQQTDTCGQDHGGGERGDAPKSTLRPQVRGRDNAEKHGNRLRNQDGEPREQLQ